MTIFSDKRNKIRSIGKISISWTTILVIKNDSVVEKTMIWPYVILRAIKNYTHYSGLDKATWWSLEPRCANSNKTAKSSCWNSLSTKCDWWKCFVVVVVCFNINCIKVKHKIKWNKQIKPKLRRSRFCGRCCVSSVKSGPLIGMRIKKPGRRLNREKKKISMSSTWAL